MSAWIHLVPDDEATPEQAEALASARTPHGTVDNVMRVHAHRPATMHGHVKLYRSVLHDDTNTVPMWLQEVVGSYVSMLNDCGYSTANHWANACHLMAEAGVMGADEHAAAEAALRDRAPDKAFGGSTLAALLYAEKLTLKPGEMVEADVAALRAAGFDDGQILEINQVAGYFAYVNRLLNGLGVTTEGDTVGYYAGTEKAGTE